MLSIRTLRNLPTVLIIDDDLVSREVMATVLTMSGYTIHTANSGDESLILLDSQQFTPELILMDMQMPGLSGVELIEQLRSRTRATIYAISGSDVPDSVMKSADGFLLKPFGPDAVQRLLDQHDAEMRRTPATDTPVINPKVLAQLREIMRESAVREIYHAVVADIEKRRPLLEAALDRSDSAEVRRMGHSIKGGCGMAGALEMAQIGELIEAGGDDLEYIRTLLPHFDTAMADLKRMLNAEFSPQGNDPDV